MLVAMLAVGGAVTALSLALGSVLVLVTPLADAAVIALGAALALGRQPFARLAASAPSGGGGPLRMAFVYGLLYGPMTLPCTGPLAVSVFGLSLGAETVVSRLQFFLAFGLGLGTPLLVLATLTGAARAAIARAMASRGPLLLRLAGVLLVVVGTYDLVLNLPAAALYLGL